MITRSKARKLSTSSSASPGSSAPSNNDFIDQQDSDVDEQGNIKDLIDYTEDDEKQDEQKIRGLVRKYMNKIIQNNINKKIKKLEKPKEEDLEDEEDEEDLDNEDEEEDDLDNYDEDEEDDEEEDDLDNYDDEEDDEDDDFLIDEFDEEEDGACIMISFGAGSKGIGGSKGSACIGEPRKNKQKYIDHINKLNVDEEFKKSLIDRISIMDTSDKKDLHWLETLIKVPFGKYSTLNIDKSKPQDIENFFDNAIEKLDNSVYGLDSVKQEIINYIAQFISIDTSNPRIIALQGSPGIGKTSIIKRGVSDILKRPIRSISMGGISDSNHFLGFDFTYSGSRHGIIAQSLIETGVMNPIIFMDELDKISETNDGQEIQNMLVHITDPIQNNCFEDKYFSGINIDLSKAIFIFSFNNIEKINPILKDRLHIIKVQEPSFDDKIVISNKYLVPEICKNIGFKETDITFDEDAIRHIISLCKYEKGVRGIKKHIESVILRLNVARFIKKGKYNNLDKINLPYKVNRELTKKIIKNEDEIPASIQMMYL
jgi:hypothetical protein